MVQDAPKEKPQDVEEITNLSLLQEGDILYGFGSIFNKNGSLKDTGGVYTVGVFRKLNIDAVPNRNNRILIGCIFFGIGIQNIYLYKGEEVVYNTSKTKLYKKTGEPTDSENKLKLSLTESIKAEQEAAALKAALKAQEAAAPATTETPAPPQNATGGGRSKRRTRRKKRTRRQRKAKKSSRNV